jgi:hypothetical protein
MIRIDEIYYNVFVSALQHRPQVGLHWFDPFGSKNFKDLVSRTCIDHGHRILFWDQEPLYRDDAKIFFDKFCETYRPPRDPPWHTTVTLVTSELNSREVKWVQDTYKIENTAHYFFHGWAALDWYRGYQHSFLSIPFDQRKITNRIFCPNNIVGGRREHRLKLFSLMEQHDLISNNYVSFPAVCPHERISVQALLRQHNLKDTQIKLPLVIDYDQNHANDSHKINFWPQAQSSFCHVVTETAYDDSRTHITEKSFKPIVLRQPFMIVGTPGSLSYLKNYGFKTFDLLWDESYDQTNDRDRINLIIQNLVKINSWTTAELKDAQQEVNSIVEHNFQWFYTEFQHVLWKELTEMIDQWR